MKNLDKIFNPKSIALIGATDRKGSVGLSICKNLLFGEDKRKIFFVNPKQKKVLKRKVYPEINSINQNIDLAVIAVPAKTVFLVAKECIQKKVGGVIIISAGFAEIGKLGEKRQKKIAQIFKKANIPLIGPNCLGIIRPILKLNATFALATPPSGSVAFVSQSGALIDSIIDKAELENYGFSSIVSFGNHADVDVSDILNYLDKDKNTKAIALYIEGIQNGKKFIKTAKKVVKNTPIIVLKAGISKAGKNAVSSHTGSLAGDPQIYSTAFKKAGVFEVETLEELLSVTLGLSWVKPINNGIGIVTNGGGLGVIAADWCERLGVELPKLKRASIKKLENSKIMNPSFSRSNPLDIVGDALTNRYKLAIETMLSQKNINGLIVIQTAQMMTKPKENAKIIIRASKKWKSKAIIACFVGGKVTNPGIDILKKYQIPNYSEPKQAVLTIKALIKSSS